MSEKLKKDTLVPIPPKRLLRYIGILGFSIPIILIIGTVFKDCPFVLHSISTYYHSIMGDFFVGSLCAIALCMYAYKGYDDTDNVMSNIAAIGLLGVAFFPTSLCDTSLPCIHFCEEEPLLIISRIHFTSAAVFFLILAFFCFVQFVKGEEPFTPEKRKRNFTYRVCGSLIILSILTIALRSLWSDKDIPILNADCFVFWAETVALWAFSIAWLIKGDVMLKDE